MPGDYTRFTFDPFADHLGVLMQQGRVTIDADFNELVELLDRQLRVRTLDTIGRCVVPRETLDGFRITIVAGKLTIGRGRAYVHGILAENHGSGDREWDPILAEQRGALPTPYDEQPYFPVPPPFSIGGPNDPPDLPARLVYLDVWQREVTHVEDPDLVEKAIGVDTATRLQTVWQVKHLAVRRDTTCATPDDAIPGWLDIIRPSGGRLTTQAVGVPASDDPCILDPAGGYRGTENRLYRVEVHQPGDLATATFKWSRDNASIATRVKAINVGLDVLTVARIGRDGVRRIAPQDWVEVVDDRLELHGLPGVLRKVQSVDEVRETVTLVDPLPGGTFNQANPQALNTRLRRWDQKGQVLDSSNVVVADVDANAGAIPVGAGGGTMVLEDGVEVTFTVDAAPGLDDFRTGDSWVLAARTIDASVERLEAAPPRAIHHHYCRLAVVVSADQIIDCRTFWPPEFGERGCDCTECVSADEHNSGAFTIQTALDRVRATGGKVCLGPGVFQLGAQPVEIHGMSSVQLQGHGFRTVLVYRGEGPAVSVAGSIDVVLERFAVAALFGKERPQLALGIASSGLVRVERCALLQLGGRDEAGSAVGLGGLLVQVALHDNVIFGGHGIVAAAAKAGGPDEQPHITVGPRPRTWVATFGLSISENLVLAVRWAIHLGRRSFHLGDNRIADNQLVSGELGFGAQGFVPFEGVIPSRLEVRGNVVTTGGHGIAVGTHQARVCDNDVGAFGKRPRDGQGAARHGIWLLPGLFERPLEGCQVLANRVGGVSGDGIRIEGPLGCAMLKQNVLRDLGGGGIVMGEGTAAAALTIENNQLFDVASGSVSGDGVAGASAEGKQVAAIRAQRVEQLDITGNTIRGFAEAALLAQRRAAIEVDVVGSARIAGNDLQRIGPAEAVPGTSFGILVVGPLETIGIHDNNVRRAQPLGDPKGISWFGIAVAALDRKGLITAGDVADDASRTASVSRAALRVVALDNSRVAILDGLFLAVRAIGLQSIAVRGNFVVGAGEESMILLSGRAVTLSDNRVQTTTTGDDATVVVRAQNAIASSNWVARMPSNDARDALRLFVAPGLVTVLGNVVEGGHIRIVNDPLGVPWLPLNVIVF